MILCCKHKVESSLWCLTCFPVFPTRSATGSFDQMCIANKSCKDNRLGKRRRLGFLKAWNWALMVKCCCCLGVSSWPLGRFLVHIRVRFLEKFTSMVKKVEQVTQNRVSVCCKWTLMDFRAMTPWEYRRLILPSSSQTNNETLCIFSKFFTFPVKSKLITQSLIYLCIGIIFWWFSFLFFVLIA